ncbi:11417_t:CDS:1, partial [Ambispora gerdemannii]
NSPDLNPIENIWKVLKDNVQNYEAFPRSIDELKEGMLFPQCQEELKQYLSQWMVN